MKLKDKVAIVTGSTKGIGVAVAQEFATEGAKVVGAGRATALGALSMDGGDLEAKLTRPDRGNCNVFSSRESRTTLRKWQAAQVSRND